MHLTRREVGAGQLRDKVAERGVGWAGALGALRVRAALVRRLALHLAQGPERVGERAAVVPDGEADGLERLGEPLALVANLRGVVNARLDAQEGDVAGREGPLGEELDRLGAGEPVEELAGAGPRAQERVDLEGDDGPRVEPQRARVLGEVGQEVLRVEEAHHGDARGHVDAVHVVAVDEGVEGLAGLPATGTGRLRRDLLRGRGRRRARVRDGEGGSSRRGGAWWAQRAVVRATGRMVHAGPVLRRGHAVDIERKFLYSAHRCSLWIMYESIP